jgi:hypothetical protein
MAVMETVPAFRSLRIVGRRASACTSATRLLASSLLVPPRSDISRSRRVSIRATEVRCHRPPTAPGMPLRFNSFASPRWETKPATISFRMVGSKARAWVSAARLPANAPCVLRLPGDVSPRTGSIGPSWQGFDARRSAKNVSKSESSGQEQVNRTRFIRDPQTSEGPPRNLDIGAYCRSALGDLWVYRKSPGAQARMRWGGEATPAGEASPNLAPHALSGLLPQGHYCFNKPAWSLGRSMVSKPDPGQQKGNPRRAIPFAVEGRPIRGQCA